MELFTITLLIWWIFFGVVGGLATMTLFIWWIFSHHDAVHLVELWVGFATTTLLVWWN